MWTAGLCSLPLGSQALLAQNFDHQAISARTQIVNSLYKLLIGFEEPDVFMLSTLLLLNFSKQQIKWL